MKYHPEAALLESYVRGEISAVDGVTVTTHLETCSSCRSMVASLEEKEAQLMEAIDSEYDVAFDSMMGDILELPSLDVKISEKKITSVQVNGKTFELPKSLSRFTKNMSEWRSYGGKVFSSTIDLGEAERVNLLYIAEGVQVPQHTHKGTESTLVLHGSFSDEDGEYHKGDFLVADGSIKHSPRTEKGQDCLCLTVLSEPMVFTQGVARVFNMFGHGMYP